MAWQTIAKGQSCDQSLLPLSACKKWLAAFALHKVQPLTCAIAQVARQQGDWLAKSVFAGHIDELTAASADDARAAELALPEFEYKHRGAAAYVGQGRAVADLPRWGPLYGLGPGLMLRGFGAVSQLSLRNKVLVLLDWLRTKAFGRDISRV